MKKLERHKLDLLGKCNNNQIYFKIQDKIYTSDELDIEKIQRSHIMRPFEGNENEVLDNKDYSIDELCCQLEDVDVSYLFTGHQKTGVEKLVFFTKSNKFKSLVRNIKSDLKLISLFITFDSDTPPLSRFTCIFNYELKDIELTNKDNTVILRRSSIETGPLCHATSRWIIKN